MPEPKPPYKVEWNKVEREWFVDSPWTNEKEWSTEHRPTANRYALALNKAYRRGYRFAKEEDAK